MPSYLTQLPLIIHYSGGTYWGGVRGLLSPLPLVYVGAMMQHEGEAEMKRGNGDEGHARFGSGRDESEAIGRNEL